MALPSCKKKTRTVAYHISRSCQMYQICTTRLERSCLPKRQNRTSAVVRHTAISVIHASTNTQTLALHPKYRDPMHAPPLIQRKPSRVTVPTLTAVGSDPSTVAKCCSRLLEGSQVGRQAAMQTLEAHRFMGQSMRTKQAKSPDREDQKNKRQRQA